MLKIIFLLIPVLSFSMNWMDSTYVDSLTIEGNFATSVSSIKEQPLWLTSLKRGIFSDNTNNIVLFSDIHYQRRFGRHFKSTTHLTPVARNAGFYDFDKGGSVFFAEYFTQFNYRKWYLRAGAKSKNISQYGGELSSGSLSQTQNARAIPMISFGADFVSVPFTKGYLQVKGELSHGWLEKRRRVTDAWLHQKSAYLKFGHPKYANAVIGFTHQGLWGGKLGDKVGKFTSNAYKSIFFGTPANDPTLPGDDLYAYGSHLGTLELSLNFQIKAFKGTLSLQRPWEDSQQISRYQILDIFFRRNKDGIFGLNLETPNSLFKNISIEYIHTSHQGGPGLPDPPSIEAGKEDPDGCKYNQCYKYGNRENYYNNYVFHDGWSYYNRSLGTPLYTHQKRILNLLKDKELGDVYGRNTIYNNRVDGFHIGLGGKIQEGFNYQFRYTFTKNYGNYYAQFGPNYVNVDGVPRWSRLNQPYEFKGGLNQSYSAIYLEKHLGDKPFKVFGQLGVDFGRMYDSFGVMLGATYSYEYFRKKK